MESVEATRLIHAWQAGDRAALDQLLPYLYAELHRLAQVQLRGESSGHTLQATALVNEAFLRLADIRINYHDQFHFLAMAATTMRRVLVDHARRKKSAKRGGGLIPVTLDEGSVAGVGQGLDILDLDRALSQLGQVDEQLASCVELVFFGGLSYQEAADALAISKTALFDDLQLAKAWLRNAMAGTQRPDER